jgi:hypothetical protein
LEIITENRNRYILALLSGKFNPKDAEETQKGSRDLSQVFTLAMGHKVFRILIDLRNLDASFDTMDRYAIMSFVAGQSLGVLLSEEGQPVKIAIISRPGIIDANNFSETVARNRGANIIVTQDETRAVAWLGIGEPA